MRRSSVCSPGIGAPEARCASNAESDAKKRATSASHASGAAVRQVSEPFAIDSAQSNRSPMCATSSTGVRPGGCGANLANDGGAPRIGFAPRYASAARRCRTVARAGSPGLARTRLLLLLADERRQLLREARGVEPRDEADRESSQ